MKLLEIIMETTELFPCKGSRMYFWLRKSRCFHGGSDGKESACSAGGMGSMAGSGRSPGERNGNPHQYSCLENSMNRGAWWTTVHGVTNSWTLLSDQHYGATVLLRDTRVVLSNLKLLVVSEREILSLNYQVGFKKVLLLKGFWK